MVYKKKPQSFEGDIKHEYSFIWKINKFSEDFMSLESKEMCLKPMCISTWKIILYTTEDKETLEFALQRTDNSLHSVSVTCNVVFRNSKETPFVSRSVQGVFSIVDQLKFCEKLLGRPTYTNAVKNDMGGQFRLCKDDALVIEGKITTTACCMHNEPKENSLNELHRSLVLSHKEKLFTDVNFIVGDDIIPAHKSILAARSPVFRTMLEADMREKSENRIVINDIEKPVLEAFLTFIYTGFVQTSDVSLVSQLYPVADKYDVQNLKDVCQHVLSMNLNETTACEILNLAEVHSDENLTNSALNYLIDNFDVIEPTEEWKKFVRNNTILAASVVSKVVAKMRAAK
ncbi:uncharacterized protein [Parasteatoda tepidariorum]|uniref:uncharacterized protein n=1 Tax=Parasteatoda tepidariorum TaxID=114398 RepID=UPI00077FBF9A|nr:TD and POZ domain-containing protein 4 [Parasteatoda tepidariorum]XP_042900345.1 TD and POZ domain-containing protein 4 [Parasteatoda tepidariorum]